MWVREDQWIGGPSPTITQKSHLGQDAQSLLQLGFNNPRGGKSLLLCTFCAMLSMNGAVAMERVCAWLEGCTASGKGREQLTHFSPLCTGAYSDTDRRRTEAPRVIQQCHPLQLQPHNGHHHPVPVWIRPPCIRPPSEQQHRALSRFSLGRGQRKPQVFTTSLLRQGMMGSLSGQVRSSVSCAVGRQGDQ